jgi:hypothetical protein
MQRDEGWESVKRLIELARKAPTTLTPERRQRICQGLIERLERDRDEDSSRAARALAGAKPVLH